MRPTGREVATVEKTVYYSHVLRGPMCHGGGGGATWGNTGTIMRQREREELWARACIVVSVGSQGQSRGNRLRTSQFG